MGNRAGGKTSKETERLVVKLSRRRKSRYEQAADIEDLNLSEWVRRVLDEAAGRLLASAESHKIPPVSPSGSGGLSQPGTSDAQQTRDEDYVLAPVIGRTAAGPAQYWSDLNFGETGVISSIERRLYDLAGIAPRRSRQGAMRPLEKSEILAVSLIQCSIPDDRGIVEFLSIPKPEGVKQLVAWRVDGDSMSPQYQDGDFVIVSPEFPAENDRACVAHQRGQLGVNCKIFRRVGTNVFLIPVHEGYATQQVPADQLEWAFRILARVQLKE